MRDKYDNQNSFESCPEEDDVVQDISEDTALDNANTDTLFEATDSRPDIQNIVAPFQALSVQDIGAPDLVPDVGLDGELYLTILTYLNHTILNNLLFLKITKTLSMIEISTC